MTRITLSIDDMLQQYIIDNNPPEHAQLAQLRATTKAMPRGNMQIAPEQGYLLSFLVGLTGARRVLEVGTFTGYSSLVMALALPANGKLVTCDSSAEWTDIAKDAWKKAKVDQKVELRLGPAVDTLNKLVAEKPEPFDLAFIDANKEDYDSYYEACLKLVRKDGLIMLDNMFRSGRVADPSINDASVASVRALNQKIAKDERVDRALIPVADGMTLVRRL